MQSTRRLGVLVSAITLLVLGSCDTRPSADAASSKPEAQAPEAALIARSAVFGNPTKSQGRISPDGQWLSWLAPYEGVMNIWIAPSQAPEEAKVLTRDDGRGIPVHYWSYGGEHVLYTQDKGGNENTHVFAVTVATGEVRDLTPLEDEARAGIESLSQTYPDKILVGINARDPQLFDLHEVTISTGKSQLLLENPGFAGWVIDNDLVPRFAFQQQTGGAMQLMKAGANHTWEPFQTIPAEDVLTTQIFGFDKDNLHFYAADSRGRNTAALVKVDAATGEHEEIARHPSADISDVLIDPVSKRVLAYQTIYTTTAWTALDETTDEQLQRLEAQVSGEMQLLASTVDGNQIVVYADAPEAPGVYYLFDRVTGEAQELFATRPALAGKPLQTMQALELKSRDGLTLVSYLTLPPGSDVNDDGRPDAPVPMVLYVHGGPWGRDRYGYNTVHQWLANRGYAVLSVNYRGSTGFGKNFVNAAVKEFAGKMHDDLIDAVSWAVDNEIADARKVAIMGGSYGGYATLVGLSFTPATFACGVDIVGPSNLVSLVESFPAYWGPMLESTWFKYVGNPAVEEDRADMNNRSPMVRVADITAPLLIGQGQNDPRVTKKESDQMVAAMAKNELPVTYLNYPDEGHGFVRPENRMSFFATSEAFLSDCLGGRYEPIGDDFAGSSVEILHGAEFVPGLSASTVRGGSAGR